MDHDAWLELVSAEADGELEPADSRLLAGHISGCPSCASLLKRFEADRRRALIKADLGHGELVPQILAERALVPTVTKRTDGVLIRRAAAAICVAAAAIAALVIIPSRDAAKNATATRPSSEALIAAHDQSFQQPHIEVKAGTTVEWRNTGTTTHRLVRNFGAATVEEVLPPGTTERATFERPGTYEYHCTIHEGMTGTVTVDA